MEGKGNSSNHQGLGVGMATALSIDQWSPTKESKCEYDLDPSLSVNFLCTHPGSNATHPNGASSSSSTEYTVHQDNPATTPDKATAARFQEIFVDLIGMHCASLDAASPRHILDDRFDSFLEQGERDFKDSLMEFLSKAERNQAIKNTHAFSFLEQMLRTRMGFRTTYVWANRRSYDRKITEKTAASEIDTAASMFQRKGSSSSDGPPSSSPPEQDPCAIDPGHVFVCNASVCDLQCDAFLCPAAISVSKGRLRGSIVRQWREKTVETNQILLDALRKKSSRLFSLKSYKDAYDQVVTFRDWPWKQLKTSVASKTPIPLVVMGEVSLEKSQQFAADIAPSQSQMYNRRGDLPPEELHINFLMETVRQFLDVALLELTKNQPKPHCSRQRYLLALPVVGTGWALAGDLTGRIIEQLLCLLSNFVNQHGRTASFCGVDVVLVCADEASYTHSQMMRRQFVRKSREKLPQEAQNSPLSATSLSFPCFERFDEKMKDAAFQLAELASDRHLALFMGAGVSIGSGLPSWFGLLHLVEDMFTATGAASERKLGAETGWDPLEMADRLEEMCRNVPDRNGVEKGLKQRVCDYIQENGKRPGLLLSLLVSLPCQSMVTQNYDQLIEMACKNWSIRTPGALDEEAASKKNPSVIPYRPQRNSHFWLLKMHGCVVAPNEIILTSEDYAAYDSSRSKALAGLVQASLMTKHLLFVGFSLSDPNYLAIVDQVRHALRPYSDMGC